MEELVPWMTGFGPLVRDLGVGIVALSALIYVITRWISSADKEREAVQRREELDASQDKAMQEAIIANTTAVAQLIETNRATATSINQLTSVVSALTEVVGGCRYQAKTTVAKTTQRTRKAPTIKSQE